jgi:hypothetical protein
MGTGMPSAQLKLDELALCRVAYILSTQRPAMYRSGFTHRKNRDGSWDSICLKCFVTVASAPGVRVESELAKTDEVHECERSILSQRANDKSSKRPEASNEPQA